MTGHQEAKLNLVLSAKDEASKIIEKSIAKIKSQFSNLGKTVSKALNADQLAKPFEESGKKISKAMFVPLEQLRGNFDKVKKTINNTSLESVKATDLTTYQLKRLNQEAGLLPKNVQVYRDKIKEAFNQINTTLVMTRTQANKYFEENKAQLKNDALAQAEASQLTSSAMKKVLEGLMQRRIEFIKESQAEKEFIKTQQALEQGYKNQAKTVYMTTQELIAEFQRLQQEYKNLEFASKDYAQFTTAQMKKIVQDFTGAKVVIVKSLEEVAKSTVPVDQAMEKMKNTVYLTSDQLVARVKEIQQQFKNLPVAAVDAAQLTEAQMKRVVESVDKVKVEMVRSMSQTERSYRSLLRTLGAKVDFIGLQIAGQMLFDIGRQAAGFFLDATKEAATFDTEMHGIISSFKVHDPQLKNEKKLYDDLAQAALDYGSKGFYSANKVAETMNALAKQGISDKDTLIKLLDTVHTVAVANQQDLQQTANVVADVYRQFGQTILKDYKGNMTKAFQAIGDNMTSALHSANISMNDFLNTMKYVGPVAGSVGWNIRDAAMAIALFGKHGITGSMTGTALNKMLISLIPTTSKQIDLFKRLGFITKDNQNIFLNQNGTFKNFDEIIKLLHEHLSKLPPAQREAAEKAIFGQHHFGALNGVIETTNDDLQKLEKHFGDTGIAAKAAGERSDSLGVKMNGLSESFKTLKKAIGEPLKGPMGQLIDWLQQLIHWFVNLPKPVRDTIVVIGAVAAAITLLAGAVMSAVAGLGLLVSGFEEGLGVLIEFAPEIGAVVLTIGLLATAFAGVKYAWDHDLGHIKEIVKQFTNYVKKEWGPFLQKLGKDAEDFRKKVEKEWDHLLNKIETDFDNWKKRMKKRWEELGPDAEKATHRIGVAFQGLGIALDGFMNVFKLHWGGVWNTAKIIIRAFLSTAGTVFGDVGNLLMDLVSGAVHIINFQWGKAWKDAENFVHHWNRTIIDIVAGLPSNMFKWGQKMMGQFQKGMAGPIAGIKKDLRDLGQWIKDHLGHFSPAKKGPLSTDDKWFPNMMKMFQKGIEDNIPGLQKSLTKVALEIQTKLAPTSYSIKSPNNRIPMVEQMLNPVVQQMRAVSWLIRNTTERVDPFLEPESRTAYDRIAGHTRNIPPTTTLYDRVGGHSAHHVTVHIHIEGRSLETDRQLLNQLQDRLGHVFRTHIPMRIG